MRTKYAAFLNRICNFSGLMDKLKPCLNGDSLILGCFISSECDQLYHKTSF